MEPLIVLFWACLILASLSFLIFAAFAKQRWEEVERIAKGLHTKKAASGEPADTLANDLQGLPDASQVLEALAKLTEALSKAPMSVAALVAAIFFALLAFGASAWDDTRKKMPTEAASALLHTEETRCSIGYFEGGRHQLPSAVEDSPVGCLDKLAERIRREQPDILVLTGRCDLREMTPDAAKIYGGNLSLAYQRALAVRQYLLGPKPGVWAAASASAGERALLLVGGAVHVGKSVAPALLREDRVVEVSVLWLQPGAAR
jgi:hypothetical protein